MIGPKDGVIVITHTGETAYALAVQVAGVHRGARHRHDHEARHRLPDGRSRPSTAETSETYTVSYTTALVALALIAQELGAESLSDDALAARPGRGPAARSRTPASRRSRDPSAPS